MLDNIMIVTLLCCNKWSIIGTYYFDLGGVEKKCRHIGITFSLTSLLSLLCHGSKQMASNYPYFVCFSWITLINQQQLC